MLFEIRLDCEKMMKLYRFRGNSEKKNVVEVQGFWWSHLDRKVLELNCWRMGPDFQEVSGLNLGLFCVQAGASTYYEYML